jgi:hypothetical protein
VFSISTTGFAAGLRMADFVDFNTLNPAVNQKG